MNLKIDTQLILSINPNLVYGRRLGLSDEETIEVAEATFSEMEQQFDEKAPRPVLYDEKTTESEPELRMPICPKCHQKQLYLKQKFCDKCGVEIIWA